MCPSLIQIGSKTAEKNSAQTNRQTNKQTNRQTDRHYENNGRREPKTVTVAWLLVKCAPAAAAAGVALFGFLFFIFKNLIWAQSSRQIDLSTCKPAH